MDIKRLRELCKNILIYKETWDEFECDEVAQALEELLDNFKSYEHIEDTLDELYLQTKYIASHIGAREVE